MTFRQTAFTDGEDPADNALSAPILIDIVSDDVRVRMGQDTVNVTINDDDSELFRNFYSPECT